MDHLNYIPLFPYICTITGRTGTKPVCRTRCRPGWRKLWSRVYKQIVQRLLEQKLQQMPMFP